VFAASAVDFPAPGGVQKTVAPRGFDARNVSTASNAGVLTRGSTDAGGFSFCSQNGTANLRIHVRITVNTKSIATLAILRAAADTVLLSIVFFQMQWLVCTFFAMA
jgi:hypothetical protein